MTLTYDFVIPDALCNNSLSYFVISDALYNSSLSHFVITVFYLFNNCLISYYQFSVLKKRSLKKDIHQIWREGWKDEMVCNHWMIWHLITWSRGKWKILYHNFYKGCNHQTWLEHIWEQNGTIAICHKVYYMSFIIFLYVIHLCHICHVIT